MTRNLVTGGMGFLGSYVARQLLADGEEVVLFQRRGELPRNAADLEGKVKIVSGDIRNWVHVVDAVESNSIDCIYHVAAALTKTCKESLANGFQTNIVGTFNVLEAARILGVKDVIFTSSRSTYGRHEPIELYEPTKIYNDTPQKADSMYGATKICCERLGEQYYQQYGLNFRSNRYGMVVGPTRQMSYYYGDWSGLIERTAQGKPYTVHSDPASPCDYIYIKDAARVLIDLKRADESKLRQRVYNVHGFLATLTEVAEAIKKYIPDAQITFDLDKSEAMRGADSDTNFEMDNTVASEDFGYQTKYFLDEMVKDFIDEVRKGRAAS